MSHLKAQTAQWSQGSTAVVQNLQWFETLLEAVHKKQLNESSAPHVCSCQNFIRFLCDVVHTQQHLLQQGILRDVSKAPDYSHGTAVWHTASWFSARST